MVGIGSDGQQRLGRRLEQQTIDRRLVLVSNIDDLRRQGEDHVEVFDGQQVPHPRLYPALRRSALTLWTMPLATGVIGDMPAKDRSPAILNCGHDFQLRQVQMT